MSESVCPESLVGSSLGFGPFLMRPPGFEPGISPFSCYSYQEGAMGGS